MGSTFTRSGAAAPSTNLNDDRNWMSSMNRGAADGGGIGNI